MPQHHPLYRRMRAAGVTLQDVADLTGRTRSAIQKQLNRDEEPDDYVREAIEKALAERGEYGEARDRGVPLVRAQPPSGVEEKFRRQVGQQLRAAFETRALMRQHGVGTIEELLDLLTEQIARLAKEYPEEYGGNTIRAFPDTPPPGEQPAPKDAADADADEPVDADDEDGEPVPPEEFEFEE